MIIDKFSYDELISSYKVLNVLSNRSDDYCKKYKNQITAIKNILANYIAEITITNDR